MKTELTIQQVAQQTGLSVDTLRYYEKIGLIEPVSRASSGHRRYAESDVEWIGFLIRLRETGMPISQMLQFAQLRRQGPETTNQRRIILEQHQQDLEAQMQRMAQHMEALHSKILKYKEREEHLTPSLLSLMKR
jgi:DNA-binding transcriptional MerR regulator